MLPRTLITLLLLLLFTMLTPATSAHAQDNSITRAIEHVEEFHASMLSELKGSLPSVQMIYFSKEAVERKKKATENLRTLDWVDRPGERRKKAVYTLLDDFITGEIETVIELKLSLDTAKKKRVAHVITGLERSRIKVLAKIAGRPDTEARKEERRRPVPIIDSSPHDKNPEIEGGGIWER